MTDIQCTFASGGTGLRDSVAALLRKPEGFRGAPLFADDRATDPVADPVCQIRPEPEDPTGLLYRLRITDFTRCGVLKRNVSFFSKRSMPVMQYFFRSCHLINTLYLVRYFQ